ncbi:RWP-RK domain transcription factor [Volvox carteri f. nagariensis]|uniref:RWP-RK domain transcription factor n=1 Tax=Volvox carteri f. nagariensis TaxID=3068 RepID=D8U032_VOLCA|nr:RWP-RK domain transcription factor [Volvox carteri f. nagariensis]EFJ46795.1 RWP-RK domain transcription factor [Volvox carteri f. nagariensis]|eukprot:XP_002952004.1 RWP-RK domain transcription factor [Volvox carteri f. nagariensis]
MFFAAGQMSSSRTGFSSHGSCPGIAHQFFNFCDPPSRQHAAFVNAKGDCVSGPAPYRKNTWPSAAAPETLSLPHDHSRAIAATISVKSNAGAAATMPVSQLPPHAAAGVDPYQCCKPPQAPAWDPYPPPPQSLSGMVGRLARSGALAAHPHLHACYGPPASVMVPLPPTAARPPLAPRPPAGAAPRSGGQAHGPVGMPLSSPSPSHQHQVYPHQPMPPQAGSGAHPVAPPAPSGTYPVSVPTSVSAPPPPPGVWPWPWSLSQPPPPPPPPPSAAPPQAGSGGGPVTGAGGNGSSGASGWTASGPPGGGGSGGGAVGGMCRSGGGSGGSGGWRPEDDEAEDALQELLLEEIAAAPWPHLSPQQKHLTQSQSANPPQELLLPQLQSQAATDGLLLGPPPISAGGTGMMDVEIGLQSRSDDALFAAWLSEMGTGAGAPQAPPGMTSAGSGSGGAAVCWAPPGSTTLTGPTGTAPPPPTGAGAAQQDSGYNRASFVNSPNSTSMPTTPTVTNAHTGVVPASTIDGSWDGGAGANTGNCAVIGGGAHTVAASLREQIYGTFDLPVADAARVLGISATELKRRCRRLGISRWPQRKLQSLRRIVQAAESDAGLSEDERKAVIELAARNREEIMADPDAPLVDLLKTVRQTQYKQSFEKRAAAAAASRRAPPPM